MRNRIVLLTLAVLAVAAGGARGDEFLSKGVKIRYEVTGEGEPVMLIHGLYASAFMNWDLPGITKELAKHFKVIAFDNRGHGQSGKPETEDQYGAEMAEDVVRLMDHLGIQKARVVGYSLGGMITMKLLTLHPERVRSAVLGGMGWLEEGSPLQRFWEKLPDRNAMVPAACLHGMAKLAVTEGQVKAVKVPVTIIVGERDPCRRLYVKPLQRIRPDWPVHIISGAGHLSCITTKEFKEELEKALTELPAAVDPPPSKK